MHGTVPEGEEAAMKYRILLFDVDNTLLDFDANEEESFRLMMEDMGETWTKEIYQTYKHSLRIPSGTEVSLSGVLAFRLKLDRKSIVAAP